MRRAWPGCAELPRSRIWLAACMLALPLQQAQAVLGANADSVQVDQMRFQGQRSQSMTWPLVTHEIRMPDGSSVREYVNPAGVVFAVAWRSRLKPDLEALLGTHFALYAASSQASAPGAQMKRQQSIRRQQLVVHEAGRMNSFAGVAYVPGLVPAGVDADALR